MDESRSHHNTDYIQQNHHHHHNNLQQSPGYLASVMIRRRLSGSKAVVDQLPRHQEEG